jgi:hypothetical protein
MIGANAEDVVIGADHPDAAVVLQAAAGFGEPGAGEIVIGFEVGELVPFVIDAIDVRLVRAGERAAELHVVGRVGEDEIGAALGELAHRLDAIAFDDPVFEVGALTLIPREGIDSSLTRIRNQESA